MYILLLALPARATCPTAAPPLVDDLRQIIHSLDQPGESAQLALRTDGWIVGEPGLDVGLRSDISITRGEDEEVTVAVEAGARAAAMVGMAEGGAETEQPSKGGLLGAVEIGDTWSSSLHFDDGARAEAWLDAWLRGDSEAMAASAPALEGAIELDGGLTGKLGPLGSELHHIRRYQVVLDDGELSTDRSETVSGQLALELPLGSSPGAPAAAGVLRAERSLDDGSAERELDLRLPVGPLRAMPASELAGVLAAAAEAAGVSASSGEAEAMARALGQQLSDPTLRGEVGLVLSWSWEPDGEEQPALSRLYLERRAALEGSLDLRAGGARGSASATRRDLLLEWPHHQEAPRSTAR